MMEDEVKVNVYMRTYAHYVSEVELTESELEQIANDFETTIDKLTADDIRDFAEDKAFSKGVPSLCHMEKIALSDWESPDKTEDSIEILER
jgi:hypothetical protein